MCYSIFIVILVLLSYIVSRFPCSYKINASLIQLPVPPSLNGLSLSRDSSYKEDNYENKRDEFGRGLRVRLVAALINRHVKKSASPTTRLIYPSLLSIIAIRPLVLVSQIRSK
jgi:hypothetical protein